MNMRTVTALSIAIAGLTGCAVFGCAGSCGTHVQSSSSLVTFLYPNGASPPPTNTVPELRIPLKVGLAFLPSPSFSAAGGPTAAQKQELLERIRKHFVDRKFVADITVIPDYYLTASKGFSGLEGVQRLYAVDVVALVSYDQVANTDEMKYRSLAYLTIVGAFVVNGSEHEVTTMVDLAVVDPNTRSLILRAGGTDTRHGVSTLVEQAKTTREAGVSGFSAATDAMIGHFDTALAEFESSVRAGTARVTVAHRDGSPSRGGGAFDLAGLLLIAPLLLRRRGPGAVSTGYSDVRRRR
jgi:rhombotail lipoprotein